MKKNYILITPVHNEEELISQVIETVIAQSVLPQKWLIVDDGSTDGTSGIIKKYEEKYDFIEHLFLDRNNVNTYYSRRIHVLLTGIEHVKDIQCDYIAFLDADITIETNYYESILNEFDRNENLGIASGIYLNKIDGRLHKVLRDSDNISTPGGLQVFRRECYESIGGHVPLPYGGSDALMGALARMKGWETRCFPEYRTVHHRPVGVRFGKGAVRIKFIQGMQEYDLGTHPFFMAAKSFRRILGEKPYLICGVFRLMGYTYASFRRQKRSISEEAIKYVHEEQMQRLSISIARRPPRRSIVFTNIPSSCKCRMPHPEKRDYILVTPAYNEEVFIDQLVHTVSSQTILPQKWIFINNGSTDDTEKLICRYLPQHKFMSYFHYNRSDTQSYYYNKVEAFQAGLRTVQDMGFDFIALLDADLTLPPTYYECILKEFERNHHLGIASGTYVNSVDGKLERVIRDPSSTPGGLQVFRRECFESIGGYVPLKWGGEDALANIVARKNGWQTQSFPKYEAIHHRPLGIRGRKASPNAKFIQGLVEYDLGTQPIFMMAKCFRRIFLEKPYFVGGTFRFLGFIQGYLQRKRRVVPTEVIKFARREQMKRLLSWRPNRGQSPFD